MTTDEQEARRRAEFMLALTTEHATLQGARSGTIAEAGSRAALYMTSLSSAVVALALVTQLSNSGDLLAVFALTVLPVVFFLGLVTYGRLLQGSIEDVFYARAIIRIRRFYAAIDPAGASYFPETGVDHIGLRSAGLLNLRWQQFLPAAAMVAIVNSVVGGVVLAAIAAAVWDPPMWTVTVVGLAGSVLIAALFLIHQRSAWSSVLRLKPPEEEVIA